MRETPSAPEAQAPDGWRAKAPLDASGACDELAGAALELVADMPDIRDVAIGEAVPGGPAPVPERRAERAAWVVDQQVQIGRTAPVVIDALRGAARSPAPYVSRSTSSAPRAPPPAISTRTARSPPHARRRARSSRAEPSPGSTPMPARDDVPARDPS